MMNYIHYCFINILAATQQIAAVASHINEYIRQHENAQKMLSIQNRLTGSFVPGIIAPGRRFIREGALMKVCTIMYSCMYNLSYLDLPA